jgi:4-diphosphocytidyl-2-C-methyl-D-erythritol kinase
MPTRVRSYSKINLGLAIGAPRPDGFHDLLTLYQTLALHDVVSVTAVRGSATVLRLSSNDGRVPCDNRNTAWKMVEATLSHLGLTAEVEIHIQKNLPIQGGMGAGSANAAAALLGLERELSLELAASERLSLAAAVGSDVPLFLVGGSVMGRDRGQLVSTAPALTLHGSDQIPCVVALPGIGVSTPQAFCEWDRRLQLQHAASEDPDLHKRSNRDTISLLSRTYASVFSPGSISESLEITNSSSGASGILPETESASPARAVPTSPENLQVPSGENLHPSLELEGRGGFENDLAENSLLALVRTGIENDFETVVFPQYPLLREIKRHLMGSSSDSADSAIYAALSGSGSALFGLYRDQAGAKAAQQRLQQHGVQAIVTTTLPRPLFWSNLFAE